MPNLIINSTPITTNLKYMLFFSESFPKDIAMKISSLIRSCYLLFINFSIVMERHCFIQNFD